MQNLAARNPDSIQKAPDRFNTPERRPEGTHHAHDVADLYRTLGTDVDVYSSALKLPTQYMHTIWFDVTVRDVRFSRGTPAM